MNLFKAIGMVIQSAVAVLTKGLKAVENVAEMAELTTSGMLEEQVLQSEQTLIEMRASFAKSNKADAKASKNTNKQSS